MPACEKSTRLRLREGWVRIMQQCIALNASFFNTHRMVRQYLLHAYWLEAIVPTGGSS